MGVPGFLPWLNKNHKVKKDVPENGLGVETLLIDSTQFVIEAVINSGLVGTEVTEDFVSELFRLIDVVVQVIMPKKIIYISFDGVPPLAKTHKKRQDHYKNDIERDPNGFNFRTLCKSGAFIQDLQERLIQKIIEHSRVNSLWYKNKVIVSPFLRQGEAEHKLFEFIRSRPEQDLCIVSSDADLIFLSLLVKQSIKIVRKKKFSGKEYNNYGSGLLFTNNDFEMIDIDEVRAKIQSVCHKDNIEHYIEDFVVLSFILGNDYVPPIPDLKEIKFATILNAYRNIPEEMYLTDGRSLNRTSLYHLFSSLVPKNDEYISEYEKEFLQQHQGQQIDVLLKEMCHNLLTLLDYTFRIYKGEKFSWKFISKHQVLPPICMILKYITEFGPEEIEYQDPYEPLFCNLLTATRANDFILPDPIKAIMYPPSPAAYMFPDSPKQLSNSKFFILPSLDIDLLYVEYQKAIKKCSIEDQNRNKTINDYLIYQGNTRDFTDISDLKIDGAKQKRFNEETVLLRTGELGKRVYKRGKKNVHEILIYKIKASPIDVTKDDKTWIPERDVARKLRMKIWTLRNISTYASWGKTANISLRFFIDTKVNDVYRSECLIGYTRVINDRRKYYCSTLVDYIRSYQYTLREMIHKMDTTQDKFCFTEEDENIAINWLKEHNLKGKTSYYDESTHCLSCQTIQELENSPITTSVTVEETITRFQNRHYRTNANIENDYDHELKEGYEIGRKVIVIHKNELIPFGSIGTIIGIDYAHNELIIMLDNEIPYGTTLHGLLKTKRGIIIKHYQALLIES